METDKIEHTVSTSALIRRYVAGGAMNREQKAWAKKLEKLLKSMPDGIELIFGHYDIAILPAGFYSERISASDLDMMMKGGQLISENALLEIPIDRSRMHPNSESI